MLLQLCSRSIFCASAQRMRLLGHVAGLVVESPVEDYLLFIHEEHQGILSKEEAAAAQQVTRALRVLVSLSSPPHRHVGAPALCTCDVCL